MNKFILSNDYKIIKKEIKRSIPILFIVSIPIHFLYILTGEIHIIGSIVPVNESIFEHFKLVTFPLILWWSINYYILRKNIYIDYKKWTLSTAVSMVITPVVITTFYYTYTGALGINSFIMDIFSLILALVIGQYLALHMYINARITNEKFYLGIVTILLIIIFTVVFTYNPPHLPIFKDSVTGAYGIN